MKTSGIDSSQIQQMLSQMKASAQRPNAETASTFSIPSADSSSAVNKTKGQTEKLDFATALKSSLDQVNQFQLNSKQLGKQFVMGDDSVNLSDVMIAGQKSNISFQATVQVRNKLVSAYSEIMNMQV